MTWRFPVVLGIAVSAMLLARFLLALVSGVPLIPPYLYSFDTVGLALALKDFDPTRTQPQPPGYPFFVAEARFLYYFCGTPERTFAVIQILISGFSAAMLYVLGKRMFACRVGAVAAMLLFTNPVFWYSSLTSPLRPHLALVSIVTAYFCWRALHGECRYFLAASVALGLGSGFRPEMLLLLFPLWAWTAWQCRGRAQTVVRGVFLLGASALTWVVTLVIASGGLGNMVSTFGDYFFSQSQATSLLLDPRSRGWLRWAGRAVLWNFLGIIPWIWAIPLGWSKRQMLPEKQRLIVFMAAWFLPSFVFQAAVHVGEPDHVLATIPVLCLVGGFCLFAGEQTIGQQRLPALKENGRFVTWIAVVGNALLFFGQFPVPQREPSAQFRGFQSIADAVLIGTYESSYARVRWVNQMMELAVPQVQALKAAANRPVVVIWGRDGEPNWRKITYYLPSEKVYSLMEAGDPAVPATMAELWSDRDRPKRYSGAIPIQIPIPREARLIWLLGAAPIDDLGRTLPLTKAPPVYYTDLPMDAQNFRWKSFEFVPQ